MKLLMCCLNKKENTPGTFPMHTLLSHAPYCYIVPAIPYPPKLFAETNFTPMKNCMQGKAVSYPNGPVQVTVVVW